MGYQRLRRVIATLLFYPSTQALQVARLQEPQLPPAAIRYTRQVTRIWCGFFIFNGAIAIATANKVLMLEHAIYSVISPEGCASILWKTAEKASEAADALGITANRLKTLGLVDKVISEPLGGAHRDYLHMMATMKKSLADALKSLRDKSVDELLDSRFERLMSYGKFKEDAAAA